MAKKFSIIIPTKNEEKNTGRLIKSVKNQTVKDIEIIVVDNYSTDKTARVARKFGAKILRFGPERSAQRNFGAKKANGKILFFLDADMEVEKKVLNQAAHLFERNKTIKAVVVPEVSVGENYWARVRALERSFYLQEPSIEAPRIFDRDAFLMAGGFDESLTAAEDWDLGQRIKRLGKIGRVTERIIHHEGKLSLFGHLKKKYYYAKNIQYYAKKHPEKFKAQSGTARLKIFAKNWKKIFADPIHGTGIFILKFLEYLVFLFAKLG
jgi:glycosyltransferase involved in cell wall biosynthesis